MGDVCMVCVKCVGVMCGWRCGVCRCEGSDTRGKKNYMQNVRTHCTVQYTLHSTIHTWSVKG